MKRTRSTVVSDSIVVIFSYIIVVGALIATLYPFVYVISCSISDPAAVASGKVTFLPVGFSLESYKKVFSSAIVMRSLYNSLWYTVVGTFCSLVMTLITAYPLSRKEFAFRRFFQVIVLIPMFFAGGLIPYFLLFNKLGLYNSRWAIILSMLLSPFYIILCRSYLQTIPDELIESARMDGCSEFRVLLQIVIPLAIPIVAVLIIYNGVGYWNQWFYSLVFLKDDTLQPLQLYLIRILSSGAVESTMLNGPDRAAMLLAITQIKYATIMVAILPIIIIYPFMQKYFVKGIMLGSVKG